MSLRSVNINNKLTRHFEFLLLTGQMQFNIIMQNNVPLELLSAEEFERLLNRARRDQSQQKFTKLLGKSILACAQESKNCQIGGQFQRGYKFLVLGNLLCKWIANPTLQHEKKSLIDDFKSKSGSLAKNIALKNKFNCVRRKSSHNFASSLQSKSKDKNKNKDIDKDIIATGYNQNRRRTSLKVQKLLPPPIMKKLSSYQLKKRALPQVGSRRGSRVQVESQLLPPRMEDIKTQDNSRKKLYSLLRREKKEIKQSKVMDILRSALQLSLYSKKLQKALKEVVKQEHEERWGRQVNCELCFNRLAQTYFLELQVEDCQGVMRQTKTISEKQYAVLRAANLDLRSVYSYCQDKQQAAFEKQLPSSQLILSAVGRLQSWFRCWKLKKIRALTIKVSRVEVFEAEGAKLLFTLVHRLPENYLHFIESIDYPRPRSYRLFLMRRLEQPDPAFLSQFVYLAQRSIIVGVEHFQIMPVENLSIKKIYSEHRVMRRQLVQIDNFTAQVSVLKGQAHVLLIEHLELNKLLAKRLLTPLEKRMLLNQQFSVSQMIRFGTGGLQAQVEYWPEKLKLGCLPAPLPLIKRKRRKPKLRIDKNRGYQRYGVLFCGNIDQDVDQLSEYLHIQKWSVLFLSPHCLIQTGLHMFRGKLDNLNIALCLAAQFEGLACELGSCQNIQQVTAIRIIVRQSNQFCFLDERLSVLFTSLSFKANQ